MAKIEQESKFDRCEVGGVRVDVCSMESLIAYFDDKISSDPPTAHPALIFDINGQGLALAAVNAEFNTALNDADVIHADGQSIVVASKIFCNKSIPERTATTDLIHCVGKAAEERGWRIYFWGARPESIEIASQRFASLYPKCHLVGYCDGYFSDERFENIVSEINSLNVDMVFIGLGKPKEQLLSVYLKRRLKTKILITAGGCFDFLAQEKSRAPKWMQSSGLEWLYRMHLEPRRLAWRYLWTNTVALWLIATKTKRQISIH